MGTHFIDILKASKGWLRVGRPGTAPMLGLSRSAQGCVGDWSRLGKGSTGMGRQKQSGFWIMGYGLWVLMGCGWWCLSPRVKMRRLQ
jgi:hypothetical protein